MKFVALILTALATAGCTIPQPELTVTGFGYGIHIGTNTIAVVMPATGTNQVR